MENDVEEIDADEGEEVLERVAVIDVAKASGKICVRLRGRQRRIPGVGPHARFPPRGRLSGWSEIAR